MDLIGLGVSCEHPDWTVLDWIGWTKMDPCPTPKFLSAARHRSANDHRNYGRETNLLTSRDKGNGQMLINEAPPLHQALEASDSLRVIQ